MSKKVFWLVSLLVVASMLLAACSGAAAPAAPAAPAATEEATEAAAAPAATEEAAATEAAPAEAGRADANALPRNETVYFNGQQWGSVVGWNPYSNNNNNAMAIAQAGQRPRDDV